MLPLNLAEYQQLVEVMDRLSGLIARASERNEPLPELEKVTSEYMEKLKSHCSILNLPITMKQIDRIAEQANIGAIYDAIPSQIEELKLRLRDELEGKLVMVVADDKRKYFNEQDLFGAGVANVFPEQSEDIAEAGKCFATGRNTACVFHLMRVLEAGVTRFARKLRVAAADIENKPWGAILQKVGEAIKEMPKKTAPAKKKQEMFSEVASHLHQIKDAWRNTSMHPKRSYTEEEARIIFDHARAFMDKLTGILI